MDRLRFQKQYDLSKQVLDEMYEEYLSSPKAVEYCHRLGIDDETAKNNISKIIDFVNDFNYCSNCPGRKNCEKDNPLVCVKIGYENGVITRQMVPCKEYINYAKFLKNFIVRDFIDEWLDIDFTKVDKNKARIEAAKIFLDVMKEKSNKWIYLTGSLKTGRSYYAAGMVNYAISKDKGPVCYLNTSKRFKELTDLNYKNNEEFERLITTYSTCPILVLDGFGNELKNDVVRDAILYRILSNRASDNLFTVFTSDFKIDEVVDLYGDRKASLPRAKQIGNLIKSMAEKEIDFGTLPIY